MRKKMQSLMPFMAIIMVQVIRYFPFKFGGWNQIQLSFTYDYGFVQRAFLGSILDVISKMFHIPWSYMRYFYGMSTMLIFTALLLWIMYKVLQQKYLSDEIRNFLYYMGLLFFIGPGWSTFYKNFAITDIWLLMLSMLGGYAIIKGKKIGIAIITSVVCVLIHTGYVFMYFNLIIGVFIYKIFIDKNERKKEYILYGSITVLTCAVMFCYMMFFSHTRQGVTLDYVLERTAEFVGKGIDEIEGNKDAIGSYLFGMDNPLGVQYAISEYWMIIIVTIILFSPIIFELCRYWKTLIRCSDGYVRLFYSIMPIIGAVMALPLYIMHSDYGRWTYAVFFYEFAVIWILNLIGDDCAFIATGKFVERVRKNKVYYLILLFYVIVLGAIEQNLISPFIATVETYCWKFFGFFIG